MNKTYLWVGITLVFAAGLAGCINETGYNQYQTLKDLELESGEVRDSLFLGLSFGMTTEQFYKHCWEMNKKGLFTDGEGNTAVNYQLKNNELQADANMNFYPAFYEDKIYKIQASYRYDGWAPWNKHLFSDSLQMDIVRLYERWFPEGNPFIKIEDEKKGIIFVKVDGNRRIIIGKYNDALVKVDLTELRIEEEIKEHGLY